MIHSRELYNILKKYIELPQFFNEMIIELQAEGLNEISTDGESIEFDSTKAMEFYRELENIYEMPKCVGKLKIVLAPESAVKLQFESYLVLKEE